MGSDMVWFRILSCVVVMLVIFCGGASNCHEADQSVQDRAGFTVSDYVTRPPINVTGDAMLDALGLSGSGTSSEPYLVQGFGFTDYSEDSAISLTDTTRHVVIRDCLFGGTGKVSVELANADNVLIYHNVFTASWRSIYSAGCSSLAVVNNSFVYPAALYSSPGVLFANNTLDRDGHYFSDVTNAVIANNTAISGGICIDRGTSLTFYNNFVGGKPIAYFEGAQDLAVSGIAYGQMLINHCRNVTVQSGMFERVSMAIQVRDSSSCIVRDLTTRDCWEGVGFRWTNDSLAQGLTIEKGIWNSCIYGVSVSESINITVTDCSISDCGYYGVNAYYSDMVRVVNSNLVGNGDGVLLTSSTGGLIANNCIEQDSRCGIHLYDCTSTLVTGNDVTNVGDKAIWIRDTNGSSIDIVGNRLSGGPIGIQAEGCLDGPLIHNNNIVSFAKAGINLQASQDVPVLNNSFADCGLMMNLEQPNWYVLAGIPLSQWIHNINGNTVNGKDLVYWVGMSSASVPATAGQVWLVDCSLIAATDLNVSSSSVGCGSVYSSDVVWDNITSDHNHYGALFIGGSRNRLTDSHLRHSYEGVFLYLEEHFLMDHNSLLYNDEQVAFWGSPGVSVEYNEFGNNMGVGILGSYGAIQNYGASNATFLGNTFHDAWCGAYLQCVYNNTFADNTIYSTWNGLWMDRVWDSYVYNNTVYDSTSCLNVWWCKNNTIVDFYGDSSTGYGGQSGTPLWIRESNNTVLDYCTFKGRGEKPSFVLRAENVTLRHTEFSGSKWGLHVNESRCIAVEDCMVFDVGNGICIQDSDWTTIVSTTVELNDALGSTAIWANSSLSCRIEHSSVTTPCHNTVILEYSPSAMCYNNTFENGEIYGVWFNYSPGSIALMNRIRNCSVAINAYSSDGCVINGNIIEDCDMGIAVWGAHHCQIHNNTLTRSGFHLDNAYLDCADNWLNGLPVLYVANLTGGTLDISGYGHVAVANCEYLLIVNGVFFNASEGLSLFQCRHCIVRNVSVSVAYEYGVNFENCLNCTLQDYQVSDAAEAGVRVAVGDLCRIEDGSVTDSLYGVYLAYCVRTVVSGNNLTGDGIGVYCFESNFTSIVNNTIVHSGTDGIGIGWSWDCVVTNNTVYDSGESGLEIGMSRNILVKNNTFYENHHWASIEVRQGYNCTILANLVRDNYYRGVNLIDSAACTIANNTVLRSVLCGIEVDSYSHDNTIYGNIIAYNDQGNARDDGWSNHWDGGASVGNGWDDYSGLGSYPIAGAAGSVDHHPWVYDTLPPAVNNPENYSYDLGTTGHLITWTPSDAHPGTYRILRNNTQIAGGFWSGGLIQIGVDGRPIGLHNYTLIVTDLGGNSAMSTVFVTVVYDGTVPTIDSPPDAGYSEGSVGHTVTWSPLDLHPDSYVVYMDMEPVPYQSGSWDGSIISVVVDGLLMGSHNCTIVVYDTSGHYAADTVWITVTDETPPRIDSPDDLLCFVGQTGYILRWNVSDPRIQGAYVLKDGIQVASAGFYLTFVNVSVDGLSVGSYNYTVIVWDSEGNRAVSTVYVHVVESGIPVINHPSDVEYMEGTTGHTITWNPATVDPDTYEVLWNGSLYESGTWYSPIVVTIDGLPVGTHNITMVVWDESGGSASDMVLVRVIFNPPPEIDSPEDISYAEALPLGIITWHPMDSSPKNYTVLVNGTVFSQGPWSGGVVSANVSGMARALYNVTAVVQDEGGKTASDTVFLRVIYEFRKPQVDHPQDIQYDYGDAGNDILWSVFDEHPWRYVVLLNGSESINSGWTENLISVNMDGLQPGVYNVTLMLCDVDLNWASDSVMVTVRGIPGPSMALAPVTTDFTQGSGVLIWSFSSPIPDSYCILLNGTVIEEGEWDGSAISYDLSSLPPGTYNVTVIVRDELGNSASDWVMATIQAARLPELATTVLEVVSLGVIVVSVIMVYRISKSASRGKKEEEWRDALDEFRRRTIRVGQWVYL